MGREGSGEGLGRAGEGERIAEYSVLESIFKEEKWKERKGDESRGLLGRV